MEDAGFVGVHHREARDQVKDRSLAKTMEGWQVGPEIEAEGGAGS